MSNGCVYGCEHCGSIFQAQSAYGFEVKRCISCGTALISKMSLQDMQAMINSPSVHSEVRENLLRWANQ